MPCLNPESARTSIDAEREKLRPAHPHYPASATCVRTDDYGVPVLHFVDVSPAGSDRKGGSHA